MVSGIHPTESAAALATARIDGEQTVSSEPVESSITVGENRRRSCDKASLQRFSMVDCRSHQHHLTRSGRAPCYPQDANGATADIVRKDVFANQPYPTHGTET